MDIFNKRSKPNIGFLVSGIGSFIGEVQLEVSETTSFPFTNKLKPCHISKEQQRLVPTLKTYINSTKSTSVTQQNPDKSWRITDNCKPSVASMTAGMPEMINLLEQINTKHLTHAIRPLIWQMHSFAFLLERRIRNNLHLLETCRQLSALTSSHGLPAKTMLSPLSSVIM